MTNLANLEAWAVTQGYDPAFVYGAQPGLPAGYVSPHFKAAEFHCNCCGKPHPTNPTPPAEVLGWLETIRAEYDSPVIVNSGYRCPEHNANVGGVKGSQHLNGCAVDFYIKGVHPHDVYNIMAEMVGDRGGVGKYDTFTHIDNRGHEKRW